MSFIAETQTKVDTVALKLQKINPSAAGRLFKLSEAVGRAQGSMYDSWASNDIHKIIGVRAIIEQMRAKDIPNRTLRLLEFIRNLLIFVPLAVTWFGISSALNSYTAFVNAILSDPKANKTLLQVPFLYLWQQGFGGYLPNWLTLSRLAFYDFILLSGLVILTFVVNIRTHLRSSRKEQEAELLQEELTDALADAALCLSRTGTSSQGGGVDISPQLRQFQEAIEKDTLSRDQAVLDAKALIDPLTPILQDMIAGAKFINQSLEHLAGTLQSLSGPMQQIASAQQVLLDNVGHLLKEQSDASQAVKQLVEDQKSWGQSIGTAINEFTTTTRSLNQLPAAINQWTAQLEALVKELSVEHQAQINVTQQTAEVATKLQVALEQVQDAANSLRSISKDYFDVMNMMQAFPGMVNANLSQVSQAILYAASRLNGNSGR